MEFREQAQRLPGLRSLYCILKLDFLNYSYLHNNFNAKQTITVYTKEDFKQLPAEYTYAHKYLQKEGIDPIFYELLFSEMTGERFESTSVYEKILDDHQEFTSQEKRVVEKLKEKYRLIPLEEDGKTKLTFGYPIRD
ncbi:MAG: hypothetical protein ACQESC_03460 [Nanobdellota archaeon]